MFDLIDTISEFYEPIRDLMIGKITKSNKLSLTDIIVYSLRDIFDGVLALVFLYMGYKLANKLRRTRSTAR